MVVFLYYNDGGSSQVDASPVANGTVVAIANAELVGVDSAGR